MPKYLLRSTTHFGRKYKRIVKRNSKLADRLDGVLNKLTIDPFAQSLRSHQISSHEHWGTVWSSRVTGDIRVLWAIDVDNNMRIILITIGGHDDVY